MIEQFFGKEFRVILACLAGYFLLAALAFKTPFAGALVAATAIAAFAVALKRLEWGIAFAFAELFANSHGHLADLPIGGFVLSTRMAVFFGVMAAYSVHLIRRRVRLPLSDTRLSPYILLYAVAFAAFLIGIRLNGFGNAFRDGNAYLYALYALPVLSAHWDAAGKRLLLQTLAAGAAWVSALTLGLVYAFSHLSGLALADVYTFIRDTRTGELTQMAPGIFRVFLQAQFSTVVAALLLGSLALSGVKGRRAWVATVASFAAVSVAILASLSRSFWVGGVAGAFVLILLLALASRIRLKRALPGIAALVGGKLFGVALLAAALFFPIPPPNGVTFGELAGLFSERATGTAEAAIDSRRKLLLPMIDGIRERPLSGHGFGHAITFVSDDPRVRARDPEGIWTTYAFEWGWLDVWLKTGLAGLAAFVWVFASAARSLSRGLAGDQAWLHAGLIASLAMLAATHAFSPYLNHPLGLGLLLFVLPFMKTKPPVVATEAAAPVAAQASTAPLMSE
ncbi:hypothetical protein EPO34_01070 [Patescibacteria group bacterium]|nr:MAG: hypothetical protein EPO34_01070 [Patescibacteria group bacterium]